MAKRIVCTPETCGGEPRIEGHRLTCANVVLSIEQGRVYSYLKDYPDLEIEDIKTCLTYCANQRCVNDKPVSFCFRCELDVEGRDNLDNEEPVKIWEKAQELLRSLEQFCDDNQ